MGRCSALDRAARLPSRGAGWRLSRGFIALRASNLYGDPASWSGHEECLATILSFVNCEKYPPSLLYLVMTLGPGLLLLAAFEQGPRPAAAVVTTFGRVPFFYYVAHIFLIHALAVGFAIATVGDGGVAVRRPAGEARRLRPRPARGLRGLARGGCNAVSALPLVRSDQARRREWWWSYL